MGAKTKDKINLLLQNGRMEEAKKICKSLCRKNSNDAEAWFILGSICGHTNDYDSAIDNLLRSISIQNNVAATHHNLGLIYLRTGKLELAKKSFKEALRLEPGSSATRLELANTLQAQGAPDDAIHIYETLLDSSPVSPQILTNIASAYIAACRYDEAILSCRKLLELQGNTAETLFMLGNTYRLAGELNEARGAYQDALKLNPDLSGVLNNLGITLYEQGLHKDAEKYFNQSLAIEPRQSDAYINLAKCFQEQRKLSAARETLERALVLYPEKPEIHWDLSLILLKLGQFNKGWREYEWRLRGKGMLFRRMPLPHWHGEDISKKTVLLTAEQGIGDEIMFSSCYPEMAKLASRVVIDCEERLAPLFRRSFPTCDVLPGKQSDQISLENPLSYIDVCISAGSIPQYIRKHKYDFPAHNGYLSANPDEIEKWRDRYRALGKNINVGISWKGGHISIKKKRTSPIKDWLPLLTTPGINFINLQYGEAQPDIDIINDISGTTIHHWKDSDPLKDMDNFAAQISALDLVISVDNSTVHLAGGLGINTWILQPFSPDWRWLEHAVDSYWYPAVRQFHPTVPDGWRSMLDSVAQHLQNFTESC